MARDRFGKGRVEATLKNATHSTIGEPFYEAWYQASAKSVAEFVLWGG